MSPEHLRQSLRRLGMTQAELAREIGVALPTVSRWATGAVPIPGYVPCIIDLMQRLRQAKKKSPDRDFSS